MAHTVVLQSLYCRAINDMVGADELILQVLADGNQVAQLTKSMHTGDTWSLGASYTFNDTLQVRLNEDDSKDFFVTANDFLGAVNVGSSDVSSATGNFTLEQANYTLTYSVSTVA